MVLVLTERDGEAAVGGPLDHLAFAVPDGDELRRWADHLTTCGIEHPGIVLELGKPSLQLRDPDGISIELAAAGRAQRRGRWMHRFRRQCRLSAAARWDRGREPQPYPVGARGELPGRVDRQFGALPTQ